MYALYTSLLTAPVFRSSVCIMAAPWLRFLRRSISFAISSGVFSLFSASSSSFSTASSSFSSSLSLLPNSVTNFAKSPLAAIRSGYVPCSAMRPSTIV